MAESGKQEEQTHTRESEPVKAHRRGISSIDQSRSLIPDSHLQYGSASSSVGNMQRGHQRQISEAPFAAIPKHMRTASVQEVYGHNREFPTSTGFQPLTSPFLIPVTPDIDNFIGFQGQDGGAQPMSFHPTPQVGQGMFAVPGQPLSDQRMLSHNGTPVFFDQSAMAQFQGMLGGSPGPLVQMYSPNPKVAPPKFTGLTPLLNFSPYPDQPPDALSSSSALQPPDGPKLEKRPLGDPNVHPGGRKHVGEYYSPNKKTRLDAPLSSSGSADPYNSDSIDDSIMDVPGDEYSSQAVDHMWTDQDVEDMFGLLEQAERYKWRYISDQFYNQYQKRIPGIACSKKYRDLFGSPEASSLLGSSLFYVAFRSGWPVINSQSTEIVREGGSDTEDRLKEEDSE